MALCERRKPIRAYNCIWRVDVRNLKDPIERRPAHELGIASVIDACFMRRHSFLPSLSCWFERGSLRKLPMGMMKVVAR